MIIPAGAEARGTIALVGDSHLTDTSSAPVRKLGPLLRDAGWTVTTFAVGGLTTRAALAAPRPYGEFDWTVLSFGTNDAAPWKAVPLAEFTSNLELLLSTATGRLVVLGPGPVSEAAAATGRTNDLLRAYSAAAASVAAAYGGAFVDLALLLDERHLRDDGVHLDQLGYDVLAQHLRALMEPR